MATIKCTCSLSLSNTHKLNETKQRLVPKAGWREGRERCEGLWQSLTPTHVVLHNMAEAFCRSHYSPWQLWSVSNKSVCCRSTRIKSSFITLLEDLRKDARFICASLARVRVLHHEEISFHQSGGVDNDEEQSDISRACFFLARLSSARLVLGLRNLLNIHPASVTDPWESRIYWWEQT